MTVGQDAAKIARRVFEQFLRSNEVLPDTVIQRRRMRVNDGMDVWIGAEPSICENGGRGFYWIFVLHGNMNELA